MINSPNERKRAVGVGLIGFGTIGRGVVRLLLDRSGSLTKGEEFYLQLRRIADLDITTPRGIDLPQGILTTDANEVVEARDIDVVIELIGGIEPARTYILKALQAGKGVVTANKALLAKCGDELFETSERNRAALFFEGSVCGGIPIVRSLRQGLVANRIDSIYGILNGTTNYILTKMTEEDEDFEESLRKAQERGYAEADPTLDITGQDAAQKLSILLRIGLGLPCRASDIFCEGIETITRKDIRYAKELGYTIKLLAVAKRTDGGVEARVHPAMIPSGTLLANVRDEFNAVELVGDAVGTQVFYGKGAGEMPTASAVVADVVELAKQKSQGTVAGLGVKPRDETLQGLLPMDEVKMPYYFRFTVIDRPGVLAEIARLLSREQISIASVIQKVRAEGSTVPIIMMTHQALERAMKTAIKNIDKLPAVKAKTQVIRVEELQR
ncbi:MAG TPA: homoserine dehydrogenase [Candidatus Latescibacteria bacterium]|nr:homoserine dehydrogenase [Candidatus Latescibacterota bacterium]